MRGYGIADIGERFGKTRQVIAGLFRRAVIKICRQNDEDWKAAYAFV